MVLDIYVCELYADACPDDGLWQAVPEKAAGTDQFFIRVQNKDVAAEYGYLGLCTPLFWQTVVPRGMHYVFWDGLVYAAAVWKG